MKSKFYLLKVGIIGTIVFLIPGLMFLSLMVLIYNKYIK
jgi:hypothetical protein